MRRAQTAGASIALLQGDYIASTAFAESALDSARRTGEPKFVANALSNLGAIVLAGGDEERAAIVLDEALGLAREVGDERITALALNNLGDLALSTGDYERAGPQQCNRNQVYDRAMAAAAAADVLLPESVAEATLVNWHKKPGDAVKRDENLIDVETDKVVLELPAPADGVLVELVKPDGSTVTSNEVIAVIDSEAKAAAAAAAPAANRAGAAPPAPAPQRRGNAGARTVTAMPAARKMMADQGVEPATVEGTGRGGRVTKGDVHHRRRSEGRRRQTAAAPVASGTGARRAAGGFATGDAGLAAGTARADVAAAPARGRAPACNRSRRPRS